MEDKMKINWKTIIIGATMCLLWSVAILVIYETTENTNNQNLLNTFSKACKNCENGYPEENYGNAIDYKMTQLDWGSDINYRKQQVRVECNNKRIIYVYYTASNQADYYLDKWGDLYLQKFGEIVGGGC